MSLIVAVMVLKPKPLIDGIVALIGWMENARSECWRLVPDN